MHAQTARNHLSHYPSELHFNNTDLNYPFDSKVLDTFEDVKEESTVVHLDNLENRSLSINNTSLPR